jgi:hypothetical protein
MGKLISIADYAKRRGVTAAAVRKAAGCGRISLIEGKVNPKRADLEWARNTHPPGYGGQNRGKRGSRQPERPSQHGRFGSDFASARARREKALADLAELELARKRGEVLNAADAAARIFALNRRARDILLAMPDRLAPRVVGLDQSALHSLISEEVRIVCEQIADIL